MSEQTAALTLHNINWLFFTTEMESVYCAVRTESFIKQIGFTLKILQEIIHVEI